MINSLMIRSFGYNIELCLFLNNIFMTESELKILPNNISLYNITFVASYFSRTVFILRICFETQSGRNGLTIIHSNIFSLKCECWNV